MTSSAKSVSLVLPIFNEAAGVEHTLSGAVTASAAASEDFEIVVVDDGSSDDSAARVGAWAARDPRVKLARLPRNRRFGGALRADLAASSKECRVCTDFDLPVPFSPRFLGASHMRRPDIILAAFAALARLRLALWVRRPR